MVIVMKPGTPEQEWKKIKELRKTLRAGATRLMKSSAAARQF